CVPYHASNRIYDKQYDFSGTIPSGSASAYIGSIPIKLEKGFYSILFSGSGDCNFYIKVNYNNQGTAYKDNFYGELQCGLESIVFYSELPIESIDIRAETGTSFTLNDVKLYEGYRIN
ncbi:hypothetical protein, partial [Clostridioides difficile]|uniref:hypothetical protein n=1 Tax=Clostridioides difficile TaxID=1496 RepID=UPI002358E507